MANVRQFVNLGLNILTNLAFDTAGNLYGSNPNANAISKITSAGIVSTFVSSGLNRPAGLAFDNAGNLYCANNRSTGTNANTISKITKNSDGTVSVSTFASGLNQPYGLAFDTAGNLYCTNNGSTGTNANTISKIDSTGNVSTFASGLNQPYGLAFDSAGNLYCASSGNDTISKITSAGNVSPFASGLNDPIGLAFDSAGNLYCTNNGSTGTNANTISKIDSAGNVSTFASGLFNPVGLAFDSAGNLYSTNANTIAKITFSIVSNICFIGSTPILTDQGIIAINKTSTKINTIRNKPIKLITKTITDDKYLVCFEKDALGHNIPSQKTIMSKNHALLYKGKMVRAKELVNINESIYRIKYKGEMLYNVLMEHHEKLVVNNLICETLDPESEIAELLLYLETLNYDEKTKCINLMNNYRKTIKNIK